MYDTFKLGKPFLIFVSLRRIGSLVHCFVYLIMLTKLRLLVLVGVTNLVVGAGIPCAQIRKFCSQQVILMECSIRVLSRNLIVSLFMFFMCYGVLGVISLM